jgi:putative membrane protein insertion efficiency factor
MGKRLSIQHQIVGSIRMYQKLRAGRPSPCRFSPSCSEYAVEAIETFGSARGGYLAVRRILRCNPFGPSGVDLVPLRKSKEGSDS